ncbi:MAG: DUF1476 domain-containing protein [Hyphomonadaceae bacterium]
MSQFDKRERAEEAKFQLNQELEFKAQARRAKLVGLWAAGLMGLTDQAADDYAKSVVIADLEEAGVEDLFKKIRADLNMHSVQLSDHQVRAKMDELLIEARQQIQASA